VVEVWLHQIANVAELPQFRNMGEHAALFRTSISSNVSLVLIHGIMFVTWISMIKEFVATFNKTKTFSTNSMTTPKD